jgi:hypothetical protein
VKRALLFLTLGTVAFAESPLDAAGWGRQTSGGDATSHGLGEAGSARRSDRLYDLRQPARSALDTLVAFSAQMSSGYSYIDDGASQGEATDFEVPQISLSIPMRRWGALGGAYWQRFRRSYEYGSSASSRAFGEGGSFEFVGSYSLRMPFLPWVAAGVNYHRLMGRDRQLRSQIYDNPENYAVLEIQDTIETRRDGGYLGGSLWMTRPDWDLGGWFSAPGKVDLVVTSGVTAEFPNPVKRDSSTNTPLTLGLGGAWRATTHQTVVADMRYADWTETLQNATEEIYFGAGWEYQGKGDRFDAYWRRIAFRTGAYANLGGASDLSTVAGTVGLGMPLGNVGTIDLAFALGHTYTPSNQPQLEETFCRVYVSLTGASLWGNPSRRRR